VGEPRDQKALAENLKPDFIVGGGGGGGGFFLGVKRGEKAEKGGILYGIEKTESSGESEF